MSNFPIKNVDDQAYRIALLIAGYIKETLTREEHIELDNWINQHDWNMQLFEKLTDEKYLLQVKRDGPTPSGAN